MQTDLALVRTKKLFSVTIMEKIFETNFTFNMK